MPNHHPDLVKVAEIFLVPSSFLVAALGAADSNPHRALCSLLGLVIAVLWLVCSRDAIAEISAGDKPSRRHHILAALPVVFVTGWLISCVIHFMLWSQPLRHG